VEQISATPEARAVRTAVKLLGGTKAVAPMVNRCHQAVQKWTEDPAKMSGMQVRELSKACGFKVPVAQMRPDIFADLTVQELGYVPAGGGR
jgi:hypothetical protein